MDHETNLSTQQTMPKKEVRIPSPDENGLRTQGHQPPPQSGQEKTSRLIFPKSHRLRSRSEFQKVSKRGKRFVGVYLCLDCLPAKKARLGISVSAKFGSAPERNRFKRQVREVFRRNYPLFPSYEFNVIPRQRAKRASSKDLMNELLKFLKCN